MMEKGKEEDRIKLKREEEKERKFEIVEEKKRTNDGK